MENKKKHFDTRKYWEYKELRAEQAKTHTMEMNENYKDSINNSICNTSIYNNASKFIRPKERNTPNVLFMNTDTVSAIFNASKNENSGKIAALNFASYKNPGGMFIKGSKAQEECLCHASTLYNVLSFFDDIYYKPNRSDLNRALYKNKALYTKDVLFFNKNDNTTVNIDIITCACPNKGAAQKYCNVSDNENYQTLAERIIFIRNIAEENKVDTLILGAFGSGVFKQDPKEVAELMKEKFNETSVKNIVYAVPGNDINAQIFKEFFSTI